MQETPGASGAAPLPPGEAGEERTLEAFLEGGIGRALGLTTQQLAIGLNVARNLILRGSYAEALRIYAALVFCEPKNVDFQLGLANCATLVGEHYLAIQAASVAIALAPGNPRGYLFSGRGCLATGSLAEAREDFGEALRLARESRDEVAGAEAVRLLAAIDAMPA